MNRGWKRWLLRAAAVLAGAAALLLWAARKGGPDGLTVENHSGQPITSLRVTVAGQTSTVRDLAGGAQAAVPFDWKGEDHFTVEGRLADGTVLKGQFGSVRDSLGGGRPRLVVLPRGEVLLRPGGAAPAR